MLFQELNGCQEVRNSPNSRQKSYGSFGSAPGLFRSPVSKEMAMDGEDGRRVLHAELMDSDGLLADLYLRMQRIEPAATVEGVFAERSPDARTSLQVEFPLLSQPDRPRWYAR